MNRVKRKFIIGDEWLYFKIYSGPKTSDKILIDIVCPLVERLLKKKYIDQWFFIRYNDPKHHIRLRFHLTDSINLNKVVFSISPYFKKYIDQNLIWKVQIDTYERELERYGFEKIKLSEELFFHESEMIVKFILFHKENQLGEDLRWIFGFLAINDLLNILKYNTTQKMELLETLKISFAKEFDMDRTLKKQLDRKYRKESPKIFNFMSDSNFFELEFMKELLDARKVKSIKVSERLLDSNVNHNLGINFEAITSSYIHMLCNRLFLANARMHEMVLYDFLFRFYKSLNARKDFVDV